jgi:hypothetical protein
VRWLQGTSSTTRPTHEAKLPVVQSALAPNSTNGLINLIRVCVLDRFQQLPHLLGRHFSRVHSLVCPFSCPRSKCACTCQKLTKLCDRQADAVRLDRNTFTPETETTSCAPLSRVGTTLLCRREMGYALYVAPSSSTNVDKNARNRPLFAPLVHWPEVTQHVSVGTCVSQSRAPATQHSTSVPFSVGLKRGCARSGLHAHDAEQTTS